MQVTCTFFTFASTILVENLLYTCCNCCSPPRMVLIASGNILGNSALTIAEELSLNTALRANLPDVDITQLAPGSCFEEPYKYNGRNLFCLIFHMLVDAQSENSICGASENQLAFVYAIPRQTIPRTHEMAKIETIDLSSTTSDFEGDDQLLLRGIAWQHAILERVVCSQCVGMQLTSSSSEGTFPTTLNE